jgi:hypothetical protein
MLLQFGSKRTLGSTKDPDASGQGHQLTDGSSPPTCVDDAYRFQPTTGQLYLFRNTISNALLLVPPQEPLLVKRGHATLPMY